MRDGYDFVRHSAGFSAPGFSLGQGEETLGALLGRSGRLPVRRLGRQSKEAILEELVAVRGIKLWTAQMFLMFKLRRLDVLAPGDLGLQVGLKRLDGLQERPPPAECVLQWRMIIKQWFLPEKSTLKANQ